MLTETVTKKSEKYGLDWDELEPARQRLIELVEKYEDDEDVQFALDLAVMEAVLCDLAAHRDEIAQATRRIERQSVDKHRKAVVKALAKHANDGTLTPAMMRVAKEQLSIGPGEIKVSAYEREGPDGGRISVAEHVRRIAGQAKQSYDQAIEQLGERVFVTGPDGETSEQSGFANLMNQIAAAPARLTEWGGNIAEGMQNFLSPSTWGERIVAGAEFLSKTGGRIRFAARVIADYGPFVGARLLHSYFRYGGYDVAVKSHGEKGMPPQNASREEVRNWAINALKDGKGAAKQGLPTKREYDLAGDAMPSEGFFIGKDGTVKLHSVGRGADHYLPFGLGHLKKMRKEGGGEMIRRRAAGGITTEDLHVGMMLGLDTVTVVSNNGVFSIDITDRAKGLRSEHMQILGRFQDLVDTHSGGRGKAGFMANDTAMGALILEFPLHFNKRQNQQFAQSQDFMDKATPKKTLLEEFRDLFDGLNPVNGQQGRPEVGFTEVNEYGHRVGYAPSGMKIYDVRQADGKKIYNSTLFPNRKADESWDDWRQKMSDAGTWWRVTQAEEKMGWRDPRPGPGRQQRQTQGRTQPSQGPGMAQRVSPPSGWKPSGTSGQVTSAREALGTEPRQWQPVNPNTFDVQTTTAPGAPQGEERQRILQRQRQAQAEARREHGIAEPDDDILGGRADDDPGSTPLNWDDLSGREQGILGGMGFGPDDVLTVEESMVLRDTADAAEDADVTPPIWD